MTGHLEFGSPVTPVQELRAVSGRIARRASTSVPGAWVGRLRRLWAEGSEVVPCFSAVTSSRAGLFLGAFLSRCVRCLGLMLSGGAALHQDSARGLIPQGPALQLSYRWSPRVLSSFVWGSCWLWVALRAPVPKGSSSHTDTATPAASTSPGDLQELQAPGPHGLCSQNFAVSS